LLPKTLAFDKTMLYSNIYATVSFTACQPVTMHLAVKNPAAKVCSKRDS